MHDRPTSDKKIASIGTYKDQLVYIDDKAVFSNAWAGKLYSRHDMPNAKILSGGKDFIFLISDGKRLSLLKDSQSLWKGTLPNDEVQDIKYDAKDNLFWILGKKSINTFSPDNKKMAKILDNSNVTCMELVPGKLIVGTNNGYFEMDLQTKKQRGEIKRKMPWTDLTAISYIDNNLWFGSTSGAIMVKDYNT